MGAWYVFASIGLYPMIPGVAGLSINTPSFNEIIINFSDDRILKISSPQINNYYIKSLLLNDKPYNSSWIEWNKIKNGGALTFNTTENKQSNWGKLIPPPNFN